MRSFLFSLRLFRHSSSARIGNLGVYAGEECARSFLFEGISVSVGPLEESAVSVGDPLNDSGSGPDVEASGRPDGHPSDMGSGLLPGGDKGPDPVTGGKTGMPFRPGQKSPGEAKGIETGPLVGPPPRRRDSEDGAIRVPHMVHLSDAGGVENVGFWETEAGPIPLGPSSGALLYGKARLFQPPEERPPGGVDGRCVPERGLGPGENLFQKIRLLREKLLDGSVPFLLIAVTTGQGQVRYAIRPAKASGMDMVDLQGNVFRPE